MKTAPCLALCLSLSMPLFALADQVIREVPDTTAGKGVGTLSGLMLGAAAGGPAGAGAGSFSVVPRKKYRPQRTRLRSGKRQRRAPYRAVAQCQFRAGPDRDPQRFAHSPFVPLRGHLHVAQ